MIGLLAQAAAGAIKIHRNDVDSQLFGHMECTLVETIYPQVFRTCALREYGDAIATLNERAETGHQRLESFRGRVVFGMVDEKSIEGIMPHPVVGQESHPRCEGKQTDKVEVGLMVADIH